MSSLPNCIICYEAFPDWSALSALACGHIFHYKCIADWSEQCEGKGSSSTCPSCMTRFEMSAARGIVRRLFFSFEDEAEVARRTRELSELQFKLTLTETMLKSANEQLEATQKREVEMIVHREDKKRHKETLLQKRLEEWKKEREKALVKKEKLRLGINENDSDSNRPRSCFPKLDRPSRPHPLNFPSINNAGNDPPGNSNNFVLIDGTAATPIDLTDTSEDSLEGACGGTDVRVSPIATTASSPDSIGSSQFSSCLSSPDGPSETEKERSAFKIFKASPVFCFAPSASVSSFVSNSTSTTVRSSSATFTSPSLTCFRFSAPPDETPSNLPVPPAKSSTETVSSESALFAFGYKPTRNLFTTTSNDRPKSVPIRSNEKKIGIWPSSRMTAVTSTSSSSSLFNLPSAGNPFYAEAFHSRPRKTAVPKRANRASHLTGPNQRASAQTFARPFISSSSRHSSQCSVSISQATFNPTTPALITSAGPSLCPISISPSTISSVASIVTTSSSILTSTVLSFGSTNGGSFNFKKTPVLATISSAAPLTFNFAASTPFSSSTVPIRAPFAVSTASLFSTAPAPASASHFFSFLPTVASTTLISTTPIFSFPSFATPSTSASVLTSMPSSVPIFSRAVTIPATSFAPPPTRSLNSAVPTAAAEPTRVIPKSATPFIFNLPNSSSFSASSSAASFISRSNPKSEAPIRFGSFPCLTTNNTASSTSSSSLPSVAASIFGRSRTTTTGRSSSLPRFLTTTTTSSSTTAMTSEVTSSTSRTTSSLTATLSTTPAFSFSSSTQPSSVSVTAIRFGSLPCLTTNDTASSTSSSLLPSGGAFNFARSRTTTAGRSSSLPRFLTTTTTSSTTATTSTATSLTSRTTSSLTTTSSTTTAFSFSSSIQPSSVSVTAAPLFQFPPFTQAKSSLPKPAMSRAEANVISNASGARRVTTERGRKKRANDRSASTQRLNFVFGESGKSSLTSIFGKGDRSDGDDEAEAQAASSTDDD